ADCVAQALRMMEAGAAEIVLTGVDLTAYGLDLPDKPMLGQLVRAILEAVPELPRLRLSSLDAVEVDDALLRAIGDEERLMPHFHLSLQHGDDLILKRMKRRHSRADAIALCDWLRRLRPDAVLGADLIAGFPTETEKMFARSLDLIEDCGLSFVHVFPFSARPETPAARMPQVPGEVVRSRARRLREAGEKALARHHAGERGKVVPVLFEGRTLGRTPQFTPVRMPAEVPLGAIRPVEIMGTCGDALIGRLAA
ncbi:MAG: radical SAM protein, partial [Parvibaculaceae bacterium]